MDFAGVLDKLIEGFESSEVRYALIGGVALGFLGETRATADIDFLIHRDDLANAARVLATLGYEKAFENEDVSHFRRKDVPAGGVDVLHAFRAISLSMLQRAGRVTIGKGRAARVAAPEDVIGLKVQSMANDPNRKARDLADIEALAARRRGTLDWKLIGEYFILFDMREVYDDLKRRLDVAD